MKDKKILVAGDVMIDTYHFGKVNRISPEAPVPIFLETGNIKYAAGGAANVAVNVRAIGVSTVVFSIIGDDKNGRQLLDLLSDLDIDTKMIVKSSQRRTTNKLRYIGPNNQQILRVDTEDTEDVMLSEIENNVLIIKDSIDEIGLILLSDYNKGFLTPEISKLLIHIGIENNIPVLVDVKDKKINKYEGAYLIKPNRKELAELSGMSTDSFDEVKSAAIKLCQMTKCKYVLTTLGADGMLLVDCNKQLYYSKSVAREVFDVTGAGDTSIAYLASEMMLGKDIFDAVEIANYAAGVQVSKIGTSVVYPCEVQGAMKDGENSNKTKKELSFYTDTGLAELEKQKKLGKRIVFTNGCFDIVHAGHISYLKEARQLGDVLVVGINSDASVKILKGEKRPINSLEDRIAVLSALECVDYIVPFEEETPKDLICKVSPDILVKGGDYTIESIVGADFVLEHGGDVRVLSFLEGRSSSRIIDLMEN